MATERRGSDDKALREALAAHARGSFEVIKEIAGMRGVGWADACNAYPNIFEHESQAILDRIANARRR